MSKTPTKLSNLPMLQVPKELCSKTIRLMKSHRATRLICTYQERTDKLMTWFVLSGTVIFLLLYLKSLLGYQ